MKSLKAILFMLLLPVMGIAQQADSPGSVDPLQDSLGKPRIEFLVNGIHSDGKNGDGRPIAKSSKVMLTAFYDSPYALKHPEECELSLAGYRASEKGCFGRRTLWTGLDKTQFSLRPQLNIATPGYEIYFGGEILIDEYFVYRKAADGSVYMLSDVGTHMGGITLFIRN